MSRSNSDKPFYVDIGTSIVAIRCASNHDVIVQYDRAFCSSALRIADGVCERMNREVEIHKPPRNCDIGTAEEQAKRLREFCKKHRDGVRRCSRCPVERIFPKDCTLAWAQLPYEKEVTK